MRTKRRGRVSGLDFKCRKDEEKTESSRVSYLMQMRMNRKGGTAGLDIRCKGVQREE